MFNFLVFCTPLQAAYKIWTTCITQRMTPLLPELTAQYQCAYKAHMSTYDAIFALNHVAKHHCQDNFCLLADLSKAFDSIPRELLWKILIWKGLPSDWVKHIMRAHSLTMMRVRIGMETGDTVLCNKGVFQGGPLSACLLIILHNYFNH